MNGKIRIKYGSMEIEFEGSEQFLKDELLEMIKTVHSFAKTTDANPFDPKTKESHQVDLATEDSELGISTIAQKLNVKTGPDLVLAAAAKLTLIDKKFKFPTKEILTVMRKSTYFKETYAKNMTSNVASLIKSGKLNDVGSGNYALPANQHSEYSQKIKTS